MELHVKKLPLPITLYLTDGSSEAGTVFLSHQSARYNGPETLQELMSSEQRFLPFKAGGDRFELIGKAGIAAIRAVAGAKPPGYYERVHGTVAVSGKHSFAGQLLVENGRGARLSDALVEPWLRIETQAGLVWANRDHIMRITTH